LICSHSKPKYRPKNNIENSQLLADYNSPDLKAGYFVKDFGQKLKTVHNIFGINIPHLTEKMI